MAIFQEEAAGDFPERLSPAVKSGTGPILSEEKSSAWQRIEVDAAELPNVGKPIATNRDVQRVTDGMQKYAQMTMLASPLHPEKKGAERAHKLCGAFTLYNKNGAARLYCGRRDCPYCYKRRYRHLAMRIRDFAKEHNCKFHWIRIDTSEHNSTVRKIKREGGDYVCLPIVMRDGREAEVIISNIVVGSPVHLDHPRLELFLSIWMRTPARRKISLSKGFRIIKPKSKKSDNFMAKIPVAKIVPHALAVGGTIAYTGRSYVRWHDVNPKELTVHLLKQNIPAYQRSYQPLFPNSDPVADEERLDVSKAPAQHDAHTVATAPKNAVPKNVEQLSFIRHDTTENVKLSHRSISSYGLVLHKDGLPDGGNAISRARSPG